ncbi:MAG: hypothetical protein ABWX70_10545 [Hyphomicrobium sp.]
MNLIELIDEAGIAARRSEIGEAYSARHGVKAQANLTVMDDQIAAALAEHLAPRIKGKSVIDVGGGFGLLSMHLAGFARHVFVIEANPVYSCAWVEFFHQHKPPNMNFLFGAAREFIGSLRADVALVASHSDVAGMMSVAGLLADEAIDVYGDMIAANPKAFDAWAREVRKTA